jgi:serine protease AprX
LLKQANPNIIPAQAKEILKNSAVDVLEGRAGADNPTAGPGIDLASGNGLVDAFRAVTLALQSRG